MKKWLLPFAVLCSSAASGTNLVQNPGFELGSFSGWTVSNWAIETGTDGLVPHSGTFYADSGCAATTCLSTPTSFVFQTLATTSGQTYTVSFWYDLGATNCIICTPVLPDDPTGTLSELQVLWGGSTILDAIQSAPLPNAGWVLFTANVLATSSSMQLEFLGRQDPARLGIDDVCVDLVGGACGSGPVPEPSPLLLSCAGIAALGLLAFCRQALHAKPSSAQS
ncbi:MAG TPA: hypothetical protein VN841_15010 [Bryobacteraceae bacterium]|nr:hypothetical protein [Bryobacteraceae bacterium]